MMDLIKNSMFQEKLITVGEGGPKPIKFVETKLPLQQNDNNSRGPSGNSSVVYGMWPKSQATP